MDCGRRCCSKNHAAELIAAVTKGTTKQAKLFLSKCFNAGTVRDRFGRTALHIAVSCGKRELVEWLIEEHKANVKATDHESGWSSLHRAVYYGQLPVIKVLLLNGADLTQRDFDGLMAIDLLIHDRPQHVKFQLNCNDTFTWGTNANLSLGHENGDTKKNPECIEFFQKNKINVAQIVMAKYHTVFRTFSGEVYSCGRGFGGRLGHGNEETCLLPHRIVSLKTENCLDIAVSRDHSIFLLESGVVLTCGSNEFGQLGQGLPACEKSLVPKPVYMKHVKGRTVTGVCAGRLHSVIFTSDSVFTFGLNAGQLGHLKVPAEPIIYQARQVSALDQKELLIKQVAASDCATAVLTKSGEVYLLTGYQCRKVIYRCFEAVSLSVRGGHLDDSLEGFPIVHHIVSSELLLSVLTSNGEIFVWRSDDGAIHRCIWNSLKPIRVIQHQLSNAGIVFVTDDGEAFQAVLSKKSMSESKKNMEENPAKKVIGGSLNISQSKKVIEDIAMETKLLSKQKDTLKSFMRTESCYLAPNTRQFALKDRSKVAFAIDHYILHRVSYVHRATSICADKDQENFALLQCQANASLTEVPLLTSLSTMCQDFSNLLSDSFINKTCSDVTIKVGSHHLPAHKFVLASRCNYFQKIFSDSSLVASFVDIEQVAVEAMREVLEFIYTDSCPFLRFAQGLGSKGNCDRRVLMNAAQRLGMKELTKRLDIIAQSGGKRCSSLPAAQIRFSRAKLPNLYDVNIKSVDNVSISCHHCVLVARLEYFRSMLSTSWSEGALSNGQLNLPLPTRVLSTIVDFLYTDDSNMLRDCADLDLLCELLAAADQLLMDRLKEIVEIELASHITLKNAWELLDFASMCNAGQLKKSCQQFVSLNLSYLLENRSLESVDYETLEELTGYYQNAISRMHNRQISAYSGWPSLEYLMELEAASDSCEVIDTSNSCHTPVKEEDAGKKGKLTRRRRSSNSKRSIGDDVSSQTKNLAESPITDIPPNPSPIISVPAKPSQRDDTLFEVPSLTPTRANDSISSPHALCTSPNDRSCNSDVWPAVGSVVTQSPSLRDIMSEESDISPSLKSHPRLNGTKKPGKLSQKERKKLILTSQDEKEEGITGQLSLSVTPSTSAPLSTFAWGKTNEIVKSFKDLMLAEEQKQQAKQESSIISSNVSSNKSYITVAPALKIQQLSMPSTKSKSQENKTPVTPGNADPVWSASLDSVFKFTDIVQDEQERYREMVKRTGRPLALIQIEEEAIQGLMRRYQSFDEHITVTRVVMPTTQPLWAASLKSPKGVS